VLFAMRFDFRNPAFAGTSAAERYAAALDMATWADKLGCVSITLSEHHGSEDGYLPSPIIMLAAMAARTTNIRFMIAAIIAPLHDPVRLAEDLVIADNLSRGRLDVVVAAGYVRSEFEMFGVPMKERVRRVTDAVRIIKAAFAGESFEYRGRTLRITPTPCGSPFVALGGSSEGAARRAARIADGFLPSEPKFWEFYRDELITLGKPDPGPCPIPENSVVALAEDAEKGWERMAPFFLHENNAYGAWQAENSAPSPYHTVADVDALRATGRYRVLTPAQMIEEQKSSAFPFVLLHPMCGGMPPDLAWESLRLFEHEVLPAFQH
jgi:alkanesulfonate monooxygenase SsuD/methylene tetrahydromethanopterin reductase-like flavin-dependent oxidoreductase (luciferase family)